MRIWIGIVGKTSNHSMEAPTPETPAMNAGCAIPFEVEPEELEGEELSEDVNAVLDFIANHELDYHDRLAVAQCLIGDVTEEFEEDILTYAEKTPKAEIDPFIIANTSQVIERLRVASEILGAVSIEDGDDEDGDEGFDEEDLTA